MNTVTLKNWLPHWNLEEDEVALYQRYSLRMDVARFIVSPSFKEVFTSDIPFRVWGEIYGDERLDKKGNKVFEDGSGVLSSFVKEIRRVGTEGEDARTFDVYTENSVYRVKRCEANDHWIE